MQSIFNLMKARMDTPELAFFQHYKDDFFVHDYRELVQWGSDNAAYLWFVRESGSDIVRLQVCEKHAERAHALLDLHCWDSSNARIFHAKATDRFGAPLATLVQVSAEQARHLLDQPYTYERREGVVTHLSASGDRHEIARLRIVWDRGWGSSPKANVRCDLQPLTLDHVTAIRLLAMAEVVEQSGSLLTPVQSITVNGEDIVDLIARLRTRSPAAKASVVRRGAQARSATA